MFTHSCVFVSFNKTSHSNHLLPSSWLFLGNHPTWGRPPPNHLTLFLHPLTHLIPVNNTTVDVVQHRTVAVNLCSELTNKILGSLSIQQQEVLKNMWPFVSSVIIQAGHNAAGSELIVLKGHHVSVRSYAALLVPSMH